MLIIVPSPGATVPTHVDDRAPGARSTSVSDLAPDLVRLALVVLGAAGFVAYFSPWGVDAIRWLLD